MSDRIGTRSPSVPTKLRFRIADSFSPDLELFEQLVNLNYGKSVWLPMMYDISIHAP